MYFKLLNDDCIHHEIKYEENKLIIDSKFDKISRCNNGLFILDINQINNWLLNFGSKIDTVQLEEDSKLIKFEDKYKTDKLRITEIKYLWEHDIFKTLVEINLQIYVIF